MRELCRPSLAEDLPPLTILVNNTSGKPGTGFIAHDMDDLESGMVAVWKYDWRNKENPFEYSAHGASFDSLVADLTASPDDAAEVYALVKTRGVRHLLFRSAVFKAYSWRCAFSGIQFSEVLEAAHIVPWANSTPQQRMDVRNGLVLTSLHHKMFDRGLITITTNYHIEYYDPKCIDREYSELERTLTVDLHGKHIHVPRLLKHRPLPQNIAQHHQIADWEL